MTCFRAILVVYLHKNRNDISSLMTRTMCESTFYRGGQSSKFILWFQKRYKSSLPTSNIFLYQNVGILKCPSCAYRNKYMRSFNVQIGISEKIIFMFKHKFPKSKADSGRKRPSCIQKKRLLSQSLFLNVSTQIPCFISECKIIHSNLEHTII